ncbi:MAG: hypothetical protein GWN55_06465 [Phycisphaerae bacterium]|nr:hypothetical protein [Phycisphaerae bacterium]
MPLSPNSRGIYERMLATAKAQLVTSEWEIELAHGRATPSEEAIAYAIEEDQGDELETKG